MLLNLGRQNRKTVEKKDKGFELIYFKLSYRQKFIRTLWLIPWIVVASILFYWRFSLVLATSIVFGIMVITCSGQAVYNYKKWKEEERKI